MGTEQEQIYAMLEELQNMAKEIPQRFQQRLSNELLSSLSTALVQGQIFEIVEMLTEVQNGTEKQLFQQRLQIQKKLFDEKQNFKTHYQKTICELSDESLVLAKTQELDRQKDEMVQRHTEELKKFDTDLILQIDQKVIDQQSTLEKAGVPGFHVTNNPTEIQVQMYMLDFITRLHSQKKNGNSRHHH